MTVLGLKLAEVRSSSPLSIPHDEESKHDQDEYKATKGDADFGSQTDRTIIEPFRVDGRDRARGSDVDFVGREDVSLK